MPQADPIAIALQAFEPGFSGQTWSKVQVLIIGMLLARGRRTVGRLPPPDGPTRVASTQPRPSRPQLRAGRPLDLSRHLLHLLVRTFASVCGDLTDVIGGALERRWGRRINLRGDYRPALASSEYRSVSASGLRWVVLTMPVTPPWTLWPWALPGLSVPTPSPEVNQHSRRRYKTGPQRARQMVLLVGRWLPEGRAAHDK
jgi:hypothetical protein